MATATSPRAAAVERLLTLDEAAELLSTSRSTVARLIRTGHLRAVDIGPSRPKLRVPQAAIGEFTRARELGRPGRGRGRRAA